MDISINVIDEDAKIPSNVDYGWVAVRDPNVGSRSNFNNVGYGAESSSTRYRFDRKLFWGTHAALGGAPWAGDFPSTTTEERDRQASDEVEKWMNEAHRKRELCLATR